MHETTFEFLRPTDAQAARITRLQNAAKAYCGVLEAEIDDGADKTFVIRSHRSTALWATIAVMRHPDGTPRR
jgi:hypothetical protein